MGLPDEVYSAVVLIKMYHQPGVSVAYMSQQGPRFIERALRASAAADG